MIMHITVIYVDDDFLYDYNKTFFQVRNEQCVILRTKEGETNFSIEIFFLSIFNFLPISFHIRLSLFTVCILTSNSNRI